MIEQSHEQKTVLIVLAAGFGRRMGQQKLLLTDGHGVPIIRRSVMAASQSANELRQAQVVIVCNPRFPEVAEVCRDLPAVVVWNDRAGEGMSTSLSTGVAWADERNSERAVILLADQPELQPSTLIRLVHTHIHCYDATVVQARYQGVPGHPIVFARSLFSALRAVSGDEGGRSIVRSQQEKTVYVDIADQLLPDLDTLDDYSAFLNRHSNK